MTRRRRRSKKSETKPQRMMLMNVIDREELRVAIIGENGLEELYIERGRKDGFNHGNIYKGKVQNVEPTLQAAFIEIGGEKNGFLHVRDIIPPFGGYDGVLKRRRRKAPKENERLPIEKMLYKGQELLVQITRESVGNKGPSLTTYVSLPGRYLVLMPAVKKRGVSRKIQDEQIRKDLKKTLDELDPPEDHGFIIRTAGMGRGTAELQNDLAYLTRLWDAVIARTMKVKPPSVIYQESDLVIRAIRDYLYDDIDALYIDGEDEHGRAVEFLKAVMPDFGDKVHCYSDSDPLFHKYGIEDEISTLMSRTVELPSGGSIVIEPTEAMVSIDVNTGRFRKGESNRDVILAINKEAAAEIARQLRLRDLGGLVMIDFIDMETAKDRRAVEDTLRNAMGRDRARVTTLPISQFGVLQMTRQRMRQSLRKALFSTCPTCGGSGLAKSPEVIALEFVRRVRELCHQRSGTLKAFLHPAMALGVANAKRGELAEIEEGHNGEILIQDDETLPVDGMRFDWIDVEGVIETAPAD